MYSRRLKATRGITAGSGFATSELRLLLLDMMLELQRRWAPVLNAMLYVDDLNLSASGRPGTIVKLMSKAVAFVTGVLEGDLGLEVSTKKSVVLASRPSLAAAAAGTMAKVKATRHAKLLGTCAVGGRRRSVRTVRVRMHAFTKTIRRYHAMRRAGVNARQMVRAAGTPAIMYGVDTAGISDSALLVARASVARAAAPQAGGKNPDLTLHTLDGTRGTLDPAFNAHVSVLKQWAQAWWEEWYGAEDLELAFQAASLRLASCSDSPWRIITGPVGALLASMQRIGWMLPSAREAIDDRGVSWNFLLDSPAAIGEACRRSVRRWRLNRIGQLLPSLIPLHVDVGSPSLDSCPNGTVLIDFAATVGQLLASRATVCKESHSWSPSWRGDLASAMSGGQWPQARKAAVPSWGIDDASCQLCHEAVGTLEHRFVCKASLPAEGWKPPPRDASLARARIGPERLRLLQNRGLLVLRLPAPPPAEQGWFEWMVSPPEEVDVASCVWYLDGSLLDGEWVEYRATGFGLAVVALDGRLVAFGRGCPPGWCTTAAAAEAWALATALTLSPFPPQLRTDCQALLTTAEEGAQKALAANRPLARAWAVIAAALDGDLANLTREQKLVWLPAHQTTAAIGERLLSNGRLFSAIDWRANRLVDALAKKAAAEQQAPAAITRLLGRAKAAVRHAAALLGEVTHAANNHSTNVTGPDGLVQVKVVRDAMPRPARGHSATQEQRRTPPPPPAPAELPSSCSICLPASLGGDEGEHKRRPPCSWSTAAREVAKRRRAEDAAATLRRVDEIAAHAASQTASLEHSSSASSRPTASERIQGVKQRVLARLAGKEL